MTLTSNTPNQLGKWDTGLLPKITTAKLFSIRLSVIKSGYSRTVTVPSIALDPTLRSGWPITVDSPSNVYGFVFEHEVAAGDLNNDNKDEIILLREDIPTTKLSVYDNHGNLLWERKTQTNSISAFYISYQKPLLVDINGDGKLEIVTVGYNGQTNEMDFEIFSGTGQSLAVNKISNGTNYMMQPHIAAGEVMKANSGMEVIVNFPRAYTVWILDKDLKNLKTIKYEPDAIIDNSLTNAFPALADLDQDGEQEILLNGIYSSIYDGVGSWAYTSRFYAFNADGARVTGFPVTFPGIADGPVQIADINKDNKDEIIVNTYEGIIVYGNSGKQLWKNRISPMGFNRIPSIADINGDGNIEIITSYFTTRGGEIDESNVKFDLHNVYLDQNGKIIKDFVYDNVRPNNSDQYVIADINGDKKLELMGNWGDAFDPEIKGGVFAWDRDGNQISIDSFPKATEAYTMKVMVADLDHDGRISIISTSNNNYNNSTSTPKYKSSIYIWDTNYFQSLVNNPWPMYQHDNAQSGNYGLNSDKNSADLVITGNQKPVVGSTYDYNIQVNNRGPLTANNVNITVMVGYDTVISAIASNGTCSPKDSKNNVICKFQTIFAGSQTEVTFRITINRSEAQYKFTVAAASPSDINPNTNSIALSTNIPVQNCEVTLNGVKATLKCVDLDTMGRYRTTAGERSMYCFQKGTPLAKDCLYTDEGGTEVQWCRVNVKTGPVDVRCYKVKNTTDRYTILNGIYKEVRCTSSKFPVASDCIEYVHISEVPIDKTGAPLPSGFVID
jgi:hypothetical protein